MPLTPFQATLARLLSTNRSADSHLAGAAAIHRLPNTKRFSNDLDYFHDSEERVASAFEADRKSLVILKNSVHFSLFFASLENERMRYPRIVLCDNVEDKGMEPKRSQNFQTILRDLSSKSMCDHQIIITTSMIEPNLDNDKYCIGEKYTKESKSLKFH